MRKVNPFGFIEAQGGDYYYEANNMVRLLPTFRGTILDLCMDSFDIYYDHHPKWTELEIAIGQFLDQRKSIRRTNIIRQELLATVMSPERVFSIKQRYGVSASYEIFVSTSPDNKL